MIPTLAESDVDAPFEYFVDIHDELVQVEERRADLELGMTIFYPQADGWYYEVTTAGRTGTHYPNRLPRQSGETFQDGSATLTCRHPSDATLPSIASVDWEVESGLTLDSQREVGPRGFFTVSGGEAGVSYLVAGRFTLSDARVIEQSVYIPRTET